MKKGMKRHIMKNIHNKMKESHDPIRLNRPNSSLDHINFEFGKTKPPLKLVKKI